MTGARYNISVEEIRAIYRAVIVLNSGYKQRILVKISSAYYSVVLNFCVRLSLRIDDFFVFTGFNFCDLEKLFFSFHYPGLNQ